MAINGELISVTLEQSTMAKGEDGMAVHWMYGLKYLSRTQPLNFKRIPAELVSTILSRVSLVLLIP